MMHADVNLQDYQGRNPLLIAAENQNAGLIQLLIQARADVNLPDFSGNLAKDLAQKNPKILKFLNEVNFFTKDISFYQNLKK